MTGKQILIAIAVALVGYSLLNLALVLLFFGAQTAPSSVIGLVINVALVTFLVLEHSWARWIIVVRCGFGAIFACVSFFSALQGSGISLVAIWLLSQIVFSISLAAFLILSKRVNEVFSPPSGF